MPPAHAAKFSHGHTHEDDPVSGFSFDQGDTITSVPTVPVSCWSRMVASIVATLVTGAPKKLHAASNVGAVVPAGNPLNNQILLRPCCVPAPFPKKRL